MNDLLNQLNSRIKSGPYSLRWDGINDEYCLTNKDNAVVSDFFSAKEMRAYLKGLLHREFI